MRLFLAIEFPEEVKRKLALLCHHLRQSTAKATWSNPENMHLTLRFFGDVPEEKVSELINTFAPVCVNHAPLTLRVSGVGAFPNPRKASVVWAGVLQEAGDLMGLQSAIESAARKSGYMAESKSFHPHATLARVRDRRQCGDLANYIDSSQNFDAGAFTVAHVALFSSDLKPKGPVYSKIQEFPLG